MRFARPLAALLASFALSVVLTGCGAATQDAAGVAEMPAIRGNVHGGQQPIAGASVYFYSAGTTGNYGSGAKFLLAAPYAVTTDANGGFSLTGLYSLTACQAAHSLVYLVAVGGNAGGGANSSSILMAAMGDCAKISTSTFTMINEVTTVAAVYALQQFMIPQPGVVGTTSTNIVGLQNAFLQVPNLVEPTFGVALTATPAGNGIVPASEINYLANIIAACVNSAAGSVACTSLFTAATPPGGSKPADTLTALEDIAQNPGNNVAALYNLPPPAVAFATSFALPNDWTIAVGYSGGGLVRPRYLAVDQAGNVWVPSYSAAGNVSEFNTVGASVQGAGGIVNSSLSGANGVAITASGTVYVASISSELVSYSAQGVLNGAVSWPCASSGITSDAAGNIFSGNGNGYGYCEMSPASVQTYHTTPNYSSSPTIDTLGNLWLPQVNVAGVMYETNAAGVATPGQPGPGWALTGASNVLQAAIDGQGNVWAVNGTSSSTAHITEMSPAGLTLSGAGYSTPSTSRGIAVDGSNTIWTCNDDGSLTHLAHTGTPISPVKGYRSPLAGIEGAMALDGSGNIWTSETSGSSTTLMEWIGVASPVVTPAALSLKNSALGSRP